MLVLAARQMRIATAVATRRLPRVSPPESSDTFPVELLDNQDVVFVCAHGIEGGEAFYGDDGLEFLTADQIRGRRMPGCIVILAGCYGMGALSQAFLEAGAAAVVADRDVNWAGAYFPTGSLKFGQMLLGYLRRGYPIGVAFSHAQKDYRAAARTPRDHELLASVKLIGNTAARLITPRRAA